MNTLFKVNAWMYGITLALYITVIGGLLFQILLGITQVIMAISLFFGWNDYTKKVKLHLSIYSGITFLYLAFFFGISMDHYMGDYVVIPFYMILPMAIGGYFVYITSLLKNEKRSSVMIEDEEILD